MGRPTRRAAIHAVIAIADRIQIRTAADGSRYGGQPLSRGALYLMLQNRIYRGEIVNPPVVIVPSHRRRT
jgi:hypothetical protein